MWAHIRFWEVVQMVDGAKISEVVDVGRARMPRNDAISVIRAWISTPELESRASHSSKEEHGEAGRANRQEGIVAPAWRPSTEKWQKSRGRRYRNALDLTDPGMSFRQRGDNKARAIAVQEQFVYLQ